MVDTKEITLEMVQAYKVLCEFGSLFLLENPTPDSIEHLIDQRELLRDEPFTSVAPEASNRLFLLLEDAHESGREVFIEEIRRNYTYLFYMVGTSHTSPFESVYRTEDHTMFGPSTLEVRASYQAWGMQLPEQGSVPDDHLGYELAFLAALMGVAEQQLEGSIATQSAKQAQDALEAAAQFLSDHTLVFAPVYLANVNTRSQEPFYAAVASIVQGTLASMALRFDAKPTEIIPEADYLLKK